MPQPPPRPTSLAPVGRPLADAAAAADALLEQEEGSGSRSSSTARRHFANVLKGFIGSNFLAVPFAFAASGLLVGPLAVGLVAAASGACTYSINTRFRCSVTDHPFLHMQATAASSSSASAGGSCGLQKRQQQHVPLRRTRKWPARCWGRGATVWWRPL